MRFTFIHAADLHIDSPLASLGAKDAGMAEVFARANRRAVEALIRETLASEAKFLIVAGDVYDGDWKDVSTGLFFARELGELERAGVPSFLVKGNHDADSVMSRGLTYPPGAHVFASGRAETRLIEPLRVALHGRSFSTRGAPDDFVASYPARREGWLNIGVLHTSLDGKPGHAPYAPCSVADLQRYGYDYWALGHIHAAEIVARDPWIVYPGNIQGRSPRETGPKGAMRVTVEDGRIVEVEPLVLDAARWALADVDVAGVADEAEVLTRIQAALRRAQGEAGGRALALRLTLTGATPLHARLVARREILEEEARALGFQFARDGWVERLRLATSPPPARSPIPAEADALDIDSLIDEAAAEPKFAALVADLMRTIRDKLPADARAALEDAPTPAELARRAALARDYLKGARA